MGTSSETAVRLSEDWVTSLSEVCGGYDRVVILVSPGGVERGSLYGAKRALKDVEHFVLPFAPANPSVEKLVELYGAIDLLPFNAIVAIGGGSVIDSAKAITLARDSSSVADFQSRLVNGYQNCDVGDFDVVAVPTTAGTGSEVTPFATVWDTVSMRKRSIGGNGLRPRYAVLDPSLLKTLGGDALLFPALDAVSHAIESLWSRRATGPSRLHALTGLSLLSRSVGTCVTETPDFERLSLGSLHAGLAIARSRTSIAHSISYPLTLWYGVPHGLACSFTLRAVHNHLYDQLGTYCEETGWIGRTLRELEVLGLGERVSSYMSLTDALGLVEQMMTPGRADNCIHSFEQGEIVDVLEQSFS